MTKVNCTVECVFQADGLCMLDEIQVVQDEQRADCASFVPLDPEDDGETTMRDNTRLR
ncbi:MAG: DUF1540 domain-containing protein [Bacillota bacterium]